jgi:hypothetical protein
MRIVARDQSTIRNWNYNLQQVQKKFLPAAFTLMNVVVLAQVSREWNFLHFAKVPGVVIHGLWGLKGDDSSDYVDSVDWSI